MVYITFQHVHPLLLLLLLLDPLGRKFNTPSQEIEIDTVEKQRYLSGRKFEMYPFHCENEDQWIQGTSLGSL